jgi:hypothetical protein
MCWGFEHGDGWYKILNKLCAGIQDYIDSNHEAHNKLPTSTRYVPQVIVDQVKEKYGTLRFYYSGGDEHIDDLVRMAEASSASTCEICGEVGKLISRGGWYSTLCDIHTDKRYDKEVINGL